MGIHIGKIIKDYCNKNMISAGTFASMLRVNPVSVYHINNSYSVKTDTLLKVSIALKHDFFQYYQAQLEDDPNKKLVALTKELNDLKKEYDVLKIENELMKKIVKVV